jgi:hypothetical protein
MDTSPKLYFLKNSEGKFFNSKYKNFSTILNANYERDKVRMQSILNLPQFQGCEIHEMTEENFRILMGCETTRVILAGQYFVQLLEQFDMKLPTISQIGKNMHKKCKSVIDELTPMTIWHKSFIKSQEDQTDEVQGFYQEFIETMATIELFQCAEVTAIMKAYHKDKASMLGITKKILK